MRAISLLFHDIFGGDPDESGFVSTAANRYKLTVADFDAQLDGVAAARTDPPILASALEHRDDCNVSTGTPPFAITVDDGGESYYTTLAGRLERRGWRGHCFVSTDFIGERGFLSRNQIRELAERGHVIGSHSASHPARFNTLPFHRIATEWARSRAALEDIIGQRVDVASVPGGYYSPVVARAAFEAGIRVVFTSEPITRIGESSGCVLAGRFTIRRGDANTSRAAGVGPARRTYTRVASWNAKVLVRPLLGRSYTSIANCCWPRDRWQTVLKGHSHEFHRQARRFPSSSPSSCWVPDQGGLPGTGGSGGERSTSASCPSAAQPRGAAAGNARPGRACEVRRKPVRLPSTPRRRATTSRWIPAHLQSPFRLLRKTVDRIVITTAGQLPPRGRRVGPSNAAQMPHLFAEAISSFRQCSGAHHYRLVGLEVPPVRGHFVNASFSLATRNVNSMLCRTTSSSSARTSTVTRAKAAGGDGV